MTLRSPWARIALKLAAAVVLLVVIFLFSTQEVDFVYTAF